MASAMNPELAQAIIASSGRLGINPLDLGTAMSYETGGKFDPALWGGKNGDYLGLIQFGPEERKKYGVHEGQSAGDQVIAAENFLRDRGVKPGMALPDIYSTINAGSPGRYNASDAANGGAPGTVMDKVTQQMGPHRANAARMLGIADAGMIPQATSALPSSTALPVAGASQPGAPAAVPAQPAQNDGAALAAQLATIPKMLQTQQAQAQQGLAPAPVMPDNMRARMAAIAAAKQLGAPS